jgi:hypothetical protein
LIDAVMIARAQSVALLAAIVLAIGSSVGGQVGLTVGIPLVTAAFALGWAAAARVRRDDATPARWQLLYAALSALAATGVASSLPGDWPRWYEHASRAVAAAAVTLLGVHAGGGARARRLALGGIVAPALALVVLAPVALARPTIDVWQWTQHCARAWVHGIQPYSTRAPDIYGGAYNYGYTIDAYPYPPFALVALTPAAVLLGDYRWMLVLCWLATIALVRLAARRLGTDERLSDLVTFALVLHPRAGFVVGMAWHEPLLVAALALFVFAAASTQRGTAQASAFAALVSLKQYFVVPALLYAGTRPRPRALATALGVALGLTVPLVLWDPRATLRGMSFALRTPFRDDGLTLTALAARLWQWRPGPALGVVAQAVAGVGAAALLWRRDRGLSLRAFLLAMALALHASFLFGAQAFINYYFFLTACYAMAAL